MTKSKKELIDVIYEEATKLATSMASRSHLFTDAGRRLCQYITARSAKDLAKAILEETEPMLEYEKDAKD